MERASISATSEMESAAAMKESSSMELRIEEFLGRCRPPEEWWRPRKTNRLRATPTRQMAMRHMRIVEGGGTESTGEGVRRRVEWLEEGPT